MVAIRNRLVLHALPPPTENAKPPRETDFDFVNLALIPMFLLPARLVGRRLQRLTRESMQLNAEMGSTMTERFNVAGAMLVKLFGRPREETALFYQPNEVLAARLTSETVTGSHCLLTVGMTPATSGLGLEEAGVRMDSHGFVQVNRVSRTSVPDVYAAGDCTGVMMLASEVALIIRMISLP